MSRALNMANVQQNLPIWGSALRDGHRAGRGEGSVQGKEPGLPHFMPPGSLWDSRAVATQP